MDIHDPLASLFITRAQASRGMIHAARATIGSLPMIARALLKRAKKPMRIVVDSRATTGSTDCETRITLPRVPLPKTEADVESAIETAALLYGLIHHEVGHCNHSDPQDIRSARPGIEQTLVNIIEDVRMENAHIRELPSSRAYLDALNMVMHRQGKWAIAADGQQPEAVFINYVMTHLNAMYRHDPMSMLVHERQGQMMESAFTPALRQQLDVLLARVETIDSSRGSFEIAREVVQLLQQEQQDAKQPDQQQDPESQSEDQQDQQSAGEQSEETDEGQEGGEGEGDDDQATGGGSGDEEQDDDTGGDSDDQSGDASNQGQQSSQQGGDAQAGQGGQGSDAEGSSGQDAGNGQPSLADRLQQLLSSQQDGNTGDKHQAAHELLQEIVTAAAQSLRDSLNLEDAIDELESAQALGARGGSSGELHTGAEHDFGAAHSASMSIRRKLLTELDALANAELHVGKRGRSLSSRHLDRVMTGDSRVFKSKAECVAPNTAVMLVQDVSGSMSGYPIQLASQALYAAALAMEGIEGIDVAAMAFPGNGKVLGFGESPRTQQAKFQLTAWGGTPMADAVLVASQALLGQLNARRLMIVLTDGAPDSYPETQSMIASAEASGIEVYGVGICTNAVQGLFTRWTQVDDISELPARLVSLVRDEVMLSMAA